MSDRIFGQMEVVLYAGMAGDEPIEIGKAYLPIRTQGSRTFGTQFVIDTGEALDRLRAALAEAAE